MGVEESNRRENHVSIWHDCSAMNETHGTGNGHGRVARLEALKLLLAEREYTTAADLADDLGVSLRTLHRDLALLRNLGVPVGGLAGRGGGVFLERGWSLGRVHLNEHEAMGLLLSLAIAQQTRSPLLLDDIRSVERKVAQAFAPSQAAKIRSLRRRVLIGRPASPNVVEHLRPTHPATTRPLLEAFTSQRIAKIRYTDQTGAWSSRLIEPHYLYYSTPVWYVLAWDQLRDDVRSFRIDRINQIEVTASTFRIRPPDRFVSTVEFDARPI
ncbi:MAG: helix-turn-helix type 11 domain-containing protein [Acidimicrobiaceae bacterium]|nr:MAG: helix-turn-helix type 11 domain-containing protein [Acidimicrobiaceae bacterium]